MVVGEMVGSNVYPPAEVRVGTLYSMYVDHPETTPNLTPQTFLKHLRRAVYDFFHPPTIEEIHPGTI